MFCNNCGVEHPDSARVCRNCGDPFLRETNTPTTPCPHCRTDNPTNANYCRQCGRPLHQEEGDPAADFFVPPPTDTPTPEVPSVQGTPQTGGVPMIQTTAPPNLNTGPGPAPKISSSPQLATLGGSAAKIIIIVVVAIVVVAGGGIGAAIYISSRPQPLISGSSKYTLGNTLVGANGTILHINGQKFSSNSAITFLLDGHVAPVKSGTISDSNGNFSTDLKITGAWHVGTHFLTARDASNYSAKKGVSVIIVKPGQASTPGPNGAPPDDATFTLNISVGDRNNTVNQSYTGNIEALHITGHPDPAGGTVCFNSDTGQQLSASYTDNNGTPFTETYSFSCKGSYKSGKISYTETLLTDVVAFTDGSGVTCTLSSPQLNQQMTGSYTGNNTFTGIWTYGPVSSSDISCSDGSTFFYSSSHGTWTGTVSGLSTKT